MKTITYIAKVVKTFGFFGEIHNQGLADLWSDHQSHILDNEQFRERNKRILNGAREASNSLKPVRDKWMNAALPLPQLESNIPKIAHISVEDELAQKEQLIKEIADCCVVKQPEQDLPWLDSPSPKKKAIKKKSVATKKVSKRQ